MTDYAFKSRTKFLSYSWKKCPYSIKYKEEYYDNELPGPSNNPALHNNPSWSPLNVTEHTTTSGSMSYKYSGGPGWICKDPNCYYYTSINPGVPYFES